MKTIYPIVFAVLLCQYASSQTLYRTIASGNWFTSSTWDGGNIPPTTIPDGARVLVNHSVTYNSATVLKNHGAICIFPVAITAAKLIVPSGTNVENMSTGQFLMNTATYLQYRFMGGGHSGTPQSGSFKNIGGRVDVRNSYVEVAQDWTSESGGRRIIDNSCLLTGQNFSLSSTGSIDTIIDSRISIGWHGSGSFSVSDAFIYFDSAAIALANTGNFNLNSGSARGHINNIALKHPVTSVVNSGNISISSSVSISNSLTLDNYCSLTVLNFIPNGKFMNTPSFNCLANSNFLSCAQTTGTIVLPLKWIHFDAKFIAQAKVSLRWTIAGQGQEDGQFIIQRSMDGINYQSIGTMLIPGSEVTQSFEFIDAELPGRNHARYYRIQYQNPLTGEHSFTRSVRLVSNEGAVAQIRSYPNPSDGELFVEIPEELQMMETRYEIFTLMGQKLLEIRGSKGKATHSLNIHKLKPGSYVLKLSGEGTAHCQVFIKR